MEDWSCIFMISDYLDVNFTSFVQCVWIVHEILMNCPELNRNEMIKAVINLVCMLLVFLELDFHVRFSAWSLLSSLYQYPNVTSLILMSN